MTWLFAFLLAPSLAQEPLRPIPEGASVTVGGSAVVLAGPSILAPLTPPSLADGISTVPSGSILLTPEPSGRYLPRSVPGKAFLLPEPMYDRALGFAKRVETCEASLEEATRETFRLAEKARLAISSCSAQFDRDDQLTQDLAERARALEGRAVLAESRLQNYRTKAVVAWAITGGVLVGVAATVITSVSN